MVFKNYLNTFQKNRRLSRSTRAPGSSGIPTDDEDDGDNGDGKGGLSGGAIAGIVLGSIAFLIVAFVIVIYLYEAKVNGRWC
ncbi:hypothetical protein ACROYT_G034424 [Oculina patagonica]